MDSVMAQVSEPVKARARVAAREPVMGSGPVSARAPVWARGLAPVWEQVSVPEQVSESVPVVDSASAWVPAVVATAPPSHHLRSRCRRSPRVP
jgi:hypothetical protein